MRPFNLMALSRVDTNIRAIAVAMLTYSDVNKVFPLTNVASHFDTSGVPLLSWRVYLLPYLGQTSLFNQFNLNEPWDSPTNLPLLEKMPDVFRSAGDDASSLTTRIESLVSAVSGFSRQTPGANQSGIGIQTVTDGTSDTIMFVEAGADKAVPWTKPDDLPFDTANPLAAIGDLAAGAFKVAFFDGHLSTLASDITAATLLSLATRAGHETVDLGTIDRREAARTGKSSTSTEVNNFRQIATAMQTYEDQRTRYPVSRVDSSGNPLLSWRVLILPYIDQINLYNQFNLNEPWDSPHNLALLDQMPDVFRLPGDDWNSTTTRVQTFTGPGAPFATPGLGTVGPTPQNITDGSSRTIMITETGSGNAVPWTAPTDEPFWPNDPFSALGDLGVNFVTALFNGAVQTRSSSISPDLLAALITSAGGEDTTNPPPINTVPSFFVYETAGNTATNEFGVDSFSVVLDKAPASNVVLTLAVSNTAVAVLDKSLLTFTPSNWNVPQRVAFRGVDNHVINEDQAVDVTISVNEALSDASYDSVAAQTFTATVRDDDLVPGDFDHNGVVQQADYEVWRSNFGATSGAGLVADGNGDGNVGAADFVLWRKSLPSAPSPIAGDYDQNGSVEAADYNVWRGSFDASGIGRPADGNHDGQVDAADYVVWRKILSTAPDSSSESDTPLEIATLEDLTPTTMVAAPINATTATDAALDWLYSVSSGDATRIHLRKADIERPLSPVFTYRSDLKDELFEAFPISVPVSVRESTRV